MSEIIAKFQAYLLTERRVSENTYKSYCYDIQQLLDFFAKHNYLLESVTSKQLKEFLYYLTELNVGARSRSRKISMLKTFYKWAAQKHGWHNHAEKLQLPKFEKKLPQYVTQEELEKLFDTAQRDDSPEGFRNQVMLCLLYTSGVRISELVHIKISDIQFDTRVVRIMGKGGRERMVPLPDSMLNLLYRYINTTYHDLFTSSRIAKKDKWLFPVVYGKKVKPISRQAFWVILKRLCQEADIKSISPHKLRHSLATHLLKKGAHLRSLQLLLGHEHISTVQIYTHLETDHLRKVYDKKHPRS